MSKKPPKKSEDQSVEWPVGSWLTWNEETGTWDKQAAAQTAETPAKSQTGREAPIPKVTSGEVAGATPAPASAPGTSSTGWRPQAERPSPVVPVERSTQVRLDRSVAVPPRAQPARSQQDRWPVSAIAAGVVAGVAAGYLLTFLVA